MPEQIEEGDSGIADVEGAHFRGVPMRGSFPTSHFFLSVGFEVAMAYQTEHDVGQAWGEVERLIDRHDKPEIENLLITVGAPDRHGLAYPSETGLMTFALETDAPELKPEHIGSVLVHFWMEGAVYQLYPRIEGIASPIYHGGFTPGHFSIATTETVVVVETEPAPDDSVAPG
jgi:hypothetical protein